MSSVYRIENEEGMGPLGRRGIELTHEIMYRHYRRDEDFVYAQMAEGVTWIGPSRAQYTTGVDKLRELLQIEQLVTFTMEQETYQVAYEDEHSCLIFGCCTVTSDEETGLFIRTLQRVSFFYRLIGDRLHVVHMHLSHPYEVVDSDEVFPFRYGKDAFDYIQQTHQMAFTDSLTELGNRNAYETSCVRMAHDFDSVRSLCLILFDLNGMKRVNDTWGHLAGDRLLRDFASLLRETMPPTAKLYRYGGDEFIAALHEVSLSDVKKKKISNLSGGMKRRVGIAQAMLNDPEILVMDEPTAGLDPGERVRLRNFISEFSHDRIVLISTHIVSDIEYISTRNAIMKAGEIVDVGTTAELVKQIGGKVWNCTIPASKLPEYEMRLRIINQRGEDHNQVSLRYLSEYSEIEGSVATEPRLEDLYLWLFPQTDLEKEDR